MVATVLIVDDDEATREVLRLLVEDAGFLTSEATDGIAALDTLRASTTPLVTLLDLDLPHADGLAVLTAIADEPMLAARHRFIVLTALGPERVRLTDTVCAELGVKVLLKPFNIDDMLRV